MVTAVIGVGELLLLLHSLTPLSKSPKTPEFASMRTSLKKVNTSAGMKENIDTGAGLTPMLTRALRKKFQVSLAVLKQPLILFAPPPPH